MKRFVLLLCVIVLAMSACGQTDSEPESGGEGIAALEPSDAPADTQKNEDTGKSEDKGGPSKDKPGRSGGGGGQGSSGGSGSNGQDSAPSEPSTDDSGSSKNKPRTAQATAAVPIPDGTHSYDTDGATAVSGNSSRMPKRTTLSARPPRGEQQVQIRDLRDSDGDGTVVETHLLYRKEGVYLTYVKITATFSGGFTDVRELRPAKAELIAPTGAGPGSKASFTMEGSGTKADVDVAAKRFEQVTIGDSTVNALVVDTRIVFSGAIEGEQNSTSWFWGKHVMAVREQVATDVSNGPIRVQSQYQAVLTRLP